MDRLSYLLGTSPFLPPSDFSYGLPNASDPENARTLTSTWTEHTRSTLKVDSNSVNFINLNGTAARKPGVSAKLVNSLAKEVKEKQAKRVSTRSAAVKPSDEPLHSLEHRCFGKPSRTSTPIADLVKNKFGNEGEFKTVERYKEYHARDIEESQHHTEIRHTKSSAGHVVRTATTPPKELFKLSKFKRVESRVKSMFS